MPNASATSNLVDQIIIHPQFLRLLQSTSIVPPLMATKIAEFDTKLKKIDYHLNSATTSAEQRAQLAAERARTEKELANVKKGIMSQLMKSEEGKKVIENIKQQVIQAAKAANLNSNNQPRPPAAGAVPGPASRPQQANPNDQPTRSCCREARDISSGGTCQW
ncbi:hypothetical protein BT69DRAFT_512514 [Atractiella rhizophila]|nr:hypothetical protein BT69DRAFT_512514 [Atractiella rhizophila]